jgi:hypothetical protein
VKIETATDMRISEYETNKERKSDSVETRSDIDIPLSKSRRLTDGKDKGKIEAFAWDTEFTTPKIPVARSALIK